MSLILSLSYLKTVTMNRDISGRDANFQNITWPISQGGGDQKATTLNLPIQNKTQQQRKHGL